MAALSLGSLFLGMWLAKRCPQRELAVYLTSWILFQAVWVALLLTVPSAVLVFGLGPNIVMDLVATVMCTAFAFAGIERRRRRQAAAA